MIKGKGYVVPDGYMGYANVDISFLKQKKHTMNIFL